MLERARRSRRRRLGVLLGTVGVGALLMFVAPVTNASAAQDAACGGKATGLGDPCGDKTGVSADVVEEAGLDEDTIGTLADQAGKNKVAINFTWTLVTGFLVMFMQAGFALVETGFCRKKNASHVMMTNFMIYGIGVLGFFLTGYALMFGGVGHLAALGGTNPLAAQAPFSIAGWNLFGLKGFGLSGVYDVGVMAHFLFNLVFMDTTATIVTGAMAERWKWSAFVVYGFFVSMVIYPIFGNWAWGGGWLAQLGAKASLGHGYVDFAGSGVVHGVGGILALAGAVVIGPRIGKFNRDGSANPMPGHNIPMALLGTFILAFGWFGFNPGSTLAATDLRISVVAVNTMLASASGAVFAMIWCMRHPKIGKPDPGMCANGMLAGLVAITAPSGFVTPWASVVIGAIAGVLVIESIFFWERRRVDDPVGAISVHGINGLWGLIALGLFADGTYGAGWNGVDGTVKGLLYGDAGQLVAQLIGCVTILVWAGGFGWVFFKVQDAIQGIRSAPEDELVGLDMPEMGAHSYLNADGEPEDTVSESAIASLRSAMSRT